MRKLFFGFCFIYLNFTLSFNELALNVLPDFVGYIFLLQGMREMESESHLFQGARPFAIGMTVYTAILWVGALLGINSEGGWVSQILDLLAMIVALYISWVLVQAVLDVESKKAVDLNGAKLYQLWKAMVALQAAVKLLSLLANLANMTILLTLVTVLTIVGLVLIVLDLIAWHKSATAYTDFNKAAV